MSECTYCGSTGWSSIGMMCRCSIGAALRMQANRATLGADIDARTESIQGRVTMLGTLPTPGQWSDPHTTATGPFPDDDLTHHTMAERLRSVGHREPVTKVQHVCVSGCGSAVSACGTQCLRCHEETVAIERRQAAKEAHWLYAVLFGLVAACPLYFVIFKLLRWMP